MNPLERIARLVRRNFRGLWRLADFRRLWLSLTITSFGAQITNLALPLTAALLLHATPLQMGILVALETLPFALVSLHAGVLLDRVRKLPIVIASDVSRGVALLVDPALRMARRAVGRRAVCGRLLLRRAERPRRCGVPGADRADGGTRAAGRGEREDHARRNVVGADRSRHRGRR